LVEAVLRMERPPAVFINASGVGSYGSRGDDFITERTPAGEGFLSEVCRQWEAAAAPVRDAGVRLVTPRFGLVVSGTGGAFATMLPAFKAGLGVKFGDGSQYWSWIALDDLLGALEWALHDEGLEGIVNATAPVPLTNAEVTQTMARVLRRPAALKAPQSLVRKATLGMGEEMLLASQRAIPERLQERGFRFAFPEFEDALRYELGRE
jgi:uncharacterized protein (TIGR01777 family)